jgi:hypothetical protein
MRERPMPWIIGVEPQDRSRIWLGARFAFHSPAHMDRDQLLRLLLPLWGVAFVAGFMMACR